MHLPKISLSHLLIIFLQSPDWIAEPFTLSRSPKPRPLFLPCEVKFQIFVLKVYFPYHVLSEPRLWNYPVTLAWVNYWVGQKVRLERYYGKTWMNFLTTSKHQLICEVSLNCCHHFYSVMVVGRGWYHTNGLGRFTTFLCNLLLSLGTSQTSSWVVFLLDITILSAQTYDSVA